MYIMAKAKRVSTAKRKSYRKRGKMSACKGKKPYACAAKPGCKITRGKKRQFCRKTRNSSHK